MTNKVRFHECRSVSLFLALAVSFLFSGFSVIAGDDGDLLLESMRKELNRSSAELQLEGMASPYYIAYSVDDAETVSIRAVLGALVQSARNRNRSIGVEVRVGSHDLDNSGFLSSQSMFAMMPRGRTLVLEDDELAIRRAIWLATDEAYKQALEGLSRKKAFTETRVSQDQIPDFSREEPVTSISARVALSGTMEEWEGLARRVSAVFLKYPAIQESEMAIRVQTSNRYFLDSGGTEVRKPVQLASIVVRASAQADDGMRLNHFLPVHVQTIGQLPVEAELVKDIERLAEQLSALASAPLMDQDYIGPVLFSEQAAGELIAQILGPELNGQRPPDSDMPQMGAMLGDSKLAGRLERRVLPSFFSITADPTRRFHQTTPLIGGYDVDDQGVRARPVILIENGVLKTLLMSRRPRKEIPSSNGHGRAMGGGVAGAQISNLFVESSETMSFEELKKEMISLCLDLGLSHGLIIGTLDNPALSGSERSGSSLMSMMMGGDQGGSVLTAPVLAYRVYADDGREELVRGITVADVSLRTLRDIVAVGDTPHVANRLVMGGGGMPRMFLTMAMPGFGLSGVPTSLVVPSLLLEELELKKVVATQEKPVLLQNPNFQE